MKLNFNSDEAQATTMIDRETEREFRNLIVELRERDKVFPAHVVTAACEEAFGFNWGNAFPVGRHEFKLGAFDASYELIGENKVSDRIVWTLELPRPVRVAFWFGLANIDCEAPAMISVWLDEITEADAMKLKLLLC